jgi:hypothetical protein
MNFKEYLNENDMFSGMLDATKTHHFLSSIRWPSFKKKLEKLATTPEQEKDIKFFEKCYQLSQIKTPEDVKSFKIKSVEDLSVDVRKDYIEFEVEINGIPVVGQFNEYNTKSATIEFLKGWRDPDTLRAIKSNSFPYPAYYASKDVLSKDERADLDKIENNLIKSFSNNETYFKESQGKQQYLKEGSESDLEFKPLTLDVSPIHYSIVNSTQPIRLDKEKEINEFYTKAGIVQYFSSGSRMTGSGLIKNNKEHVGLREHGMYQSLFIAHFKYLIKIFGNPSVYKEGTSNYYYWGVEFKDGLKAIMSVIAFSFTPSPEDPVVLKIDAGTKGKSEEILKRVETLVKIKSYNLNKGAENMFGGMIGSI